MYVLTDSDNVIIHISPTIDYQENGNPLVDNGELAIAAILVANVSEDIEVPAGVQKGTHTYVDGVFEENPNYVAPPISTEALISNLEAQVTDLQLAIVDLYEATLI